MPHRRTIRGVATSANLGKVPVIYSSNKRCETIFVHDNIHSVLSCSLPCSNTHNINGAKRPNLPSLYRMSSAHSRDLQSIKSGVKYSLGLGCFESPSQSSSQPELLLAPVAGGGCSRTTIAANREHDHAVGRSFLSLNALKTAALTRVNVVLPFFACQRYCHHKNFRPHWISGFPTSQTTVKHSNCCGVRLQVSFFVDDGSAMWP